MQPFFFARSSRNEGQHNHIKTWGMEKMCRISCLSQAKHLSSTSHMKSLVWSLLAQVFQGEFDYDKVCTLSHNTPWLQFLNYFFYSQCAMLCKMVKSRDHNIMLRSQWHIQGRGSAPVLPLSTCWTKPKALNPGAEADKPIFESTFLLYLYYFFTIIYSCKLTMIGVMSLN